MDDSAYILSLIDGVKKKLSVDPNRIYLVGHSNGGFMTHKFACDHSDVVAAIADLAGATYDDSSMCKATSKVSVLHLHGPMDDLVLYEGGDILTVKYPSAA